MCKNIMLKFLAFILMTNVNAQVINSGGGGPERDNQIDKEAKEVILKREKKLNILKEKMKVWVKGAKGRWETCHGESIEAKNIVDLYLVIVLKEATNVFMEKCKRANKTNCIFQDKKENENLRNILQDEMLDEYLTGKGLKNKKSKEDFKKFYYKKIKGK